MSVTTPTGSSGSKDKNRRKRNNPVKIDVSLNENSPTSPIDASLVTLNSNESTPVLVIRSDSKEDSPGANLGYPLQAEPSTTPITPIFTPILPSQSIITHVSFDNEDQHINVTDSTTILSTAHVIQTIENPLSLNSDLNNSKEELNKSASSEASVPITRPEQILNQTRVLSVNIAKDDTFIKESVSHSKSFRPLSSLSRSDEKPPTQADTQKNDSYCWSCHEGGSVVCCDTCPRVFHLKCAHIESEPPEDHEWLCPICNKMRSNKRRRGEAPPNITELLGFVMKKLKFEGTDQFQKEVSEEIAPGYRELVFHPMDLGKIERNLSSYDTTSQLRYEVEWIQHNCIIYNGTRNSLTKTARQIVKMCRSELSEIEYCANCYKLSCMRPIGWFSHVCDPPHAVVQAKVKGHPQWPGKLINKGRERCEIRFFGREHMRATVPINCIYPLRDGESPPPPSNNKSAVYWPDAVSELKLYQANLRDWLLAHPEHKMVQPDFSSDVVPFTSTLSVDKNKSSDNAATQLIPPSMKKIPKAETPSLASPSLEHNSAIYPHTPVSAPITIYASSNPVHQPVLKLNTDVEPGTSKFPSDDPVLSRRLIPKDSSLPAPKPVTERDPATAGGRFHFSETQSEDELEDPSFMVNPKQPGRTRKRKTGPVDSKQNKKVVFSGGVNNRVVSAGRGRGRKNEVGIRKPLNFQFTPDSLNDKMTSTNLKQDLMPLVQNVALSNSAAMPELIEMNLALSMKQLEQQKPVEEQTNTDHIHSKYSKLFLDKFERLILDLVSDLNTGQMEHIQEMLDGIVSREAKSRERIYTEVYSNIREDMQRLIQQCHDVAKIEVERQSNEIQKVCDKRMDQEVKDTKKKTWCSYCWSEAYYNCCWNVNYCSEKCQKLHWVEHKPHCIQILNTTDTGGTHRPSAPLDAPSSSRERGDSISMEFRHFPDNEPIVNNKKNAAIDNSREMLNHEDPLHERVGYRSPQRLNTHPTSVIPQSNTGHHLQDKVKAEKHPPPNSHLFNSQHKMPPNTTVDNSNATTPVHANPPNFPQVNSSQMMSKEQYETLPPRGHLRYASFPTAPPHQSPRGQQAPTPVPISIPIPGVSQPLSQLKTNIPSTGLASLATSGQQKDPPTSHKLDGYKRVRDTARTGAQSPHPSVNPVMIPGALEGHAPPTPHSFIIHSGAPPVAGAPTTPTSNQPKVVPNPFHPSVGAPNMPVGAPIYQFMNGDLSANLMMRYPFPIANQGGLIQSQGTLQPNPHSMTPRPHD